MSKCVRRGCTHTQCSRYNHILGHLCSECYAELRVVYSYTSIATFLNTPKAANCDDLIEELFPIAEN